MGIGEKTPLLATSRSQRGRIGRRRTAVEAPQPTSDPQQLLHNFRTTASETACHCGTHEGVGIWFSKDLSGSFLAVSVWIAISVVSGTILSQTSHLYLGGGLCTTTCLALASHAKTALTDPGSVPRRAVVRNTNSYCAICQVEKPLLAHHCRTCRRCICRMDHHCPWVKNCIGASNMKHFVLFLIYTWITCILALVESFYLEYLMGLVFSLFGLTFVSYILAHTIRSIRTGLGAIDRLQGKQQQQQRALRLIDIFGGNYMMWCLPVDPRFRDLEKVMGYTMNSEPSFPNRVYQTRRWEFPTEVVDI